VRAAFETHSLLVFRDQAIADDIQVAYSRAFGPLELTKVASLGAGGFYSRLTNLGDKGEIVPPDHRQVLVAKANALWHTDSSFKKTPALASVLTARVLPGEDGDTEFTSTRLAWERLPADLQGRLKDAVATHSYANSRDQIHPDLANAEERKALPPVRWRLNWRNPANDRRALYVASHAYAIDGMDDRDARQLLAQLLDEATRREFVYTHKWRQGDAVDVGQPRHAPSRPAVGLQQGTLDGAHDHLCDRRRRIRRSAAAGALGGAAKAYPVVSVVLPFGCPFEVPPRWRTDA